MTDIKNDRIIEYVLKGNLKQLQLLYSSGGITISSLNDAFVVSCANGLLEIAKWLYSLGINIHEDEDDAFVSSCVNNQLKVAKWLFQLHRTLNNSCQELYELGGIDVHAQNKEAFVGSCNVHNLKIAKWLCSICDNYKLINDKGYIGVLSTNAFGKDIIGNLKKNIMNNNVPLNEDVLKFGMFYSMKNVVMKCLDNKIMLPVGSLKFLFTKENIKTTGYKIWVECDKFPQPHHNKKNIVRMLFNYGYRLNEIDKEILKKKKSIVKNLFNI